MNCRFPQERLALWVEGDLPAVENERTEQHVTGCDNCRRAVDELRESQAMLKGLRREIAGSAECSEMRRGVMAIVGAGYRTGWRVALERAFMLNLRRSYAIAAAVVIVGVSVSLTAKIPYAAPHRGSDTVSDPIESQARLPRPDGYRDWVALGAGVAAPAHRVYVNPSAYRDYERTGVFPDGTVMIWEPRADSPEAGARPHGSSAVLLASVKDSARFDGGWAYFDFTGADGRTAASASALPASSTCGKCHRKDGATDPVLTLSVAAPPSV